MIRQTSKTLLLVLLLSLPTAWAVDNFEEQLTCLRMAVRNLALTDSPYVVPVPYNEGPTSYLLSEKDMPWTSSYFPMAQGGIAKLWQGEDIPGDLWEPGELYEKTDAATVINRLRELTQAELNRLSAIEKFDILNGRYDFVATRTEQMKRGKKRDPQPQWWEGFCNGVCAASVNLPEPAHPVTLTNPDGIKVTFQPNDIKALANASYYFVEKYAQVGSPNRTELPINFETLPNPGVLDWALTHYLAGLGKSFVADKVPGKEVWNHTVVGYRDRTLGKVLPAGRGVPQGVKYKVMVNLGIDYSGPGITHQQSNTPIAPLMAAGQHIETRPYRYELYLDQDKNIIGGRWPKGGKKPTTDAPAFLWFPGGRGADAVQGLNPYLDANQIESLVRQSATASP